MPILCVRWMEVYQRDYDPQRPVVCMDETSKQLVGETRVPVPVAPGRTARVDYEYERKGTANLFMVTEPLVGQRRVQVTETLYGGPADGSPAVMQSVSGGHLMLADPACSISDCGVSFALTVPPGVTVTVVTDGGPLTVAGTAGANLDSAGGPVHATRIGGPLTVSTGGGLLLLNGLVGALRADTDGGPLNAQGVDAATANVTTGGGEALIAFSAAPDKVTVSTDGGLAIITVPGGPYALTADSGGGPESAEIATNPAASRSITVSSGGGPLEIRS